MLTVDQCCGECKWHKKDSEYGWVCKNPDSTYYTDATLYDDTCVDWEEV